MDINGDGIDALIIDTADADPNDNDAARESYVVFGRNQGSAVSLNLVDLDGRKGCRQCSGKK